MRIAAFTMVHNEADFLPLWVRHYGREFGVENLYCIDHGSDDGCTDGLGISVTRFPRSRKFDTAVRSFLVANFHASLLRTHDVVVFSDADEFLVADPAKFTGLREAIAASGAPLLRAMGLDVLHEPAREAAFDRRLPILAQRRRVKFARHYCKTLIASVPVRWGPGFHACSSHVQPSGELFLFHLKYADRDIFIRSLETRRQVERSAIDVDKGYGYQWRMGTAEYLDLAYANPALAPPGGDAALAPFDAYMEHWRTQIIDNAVMPDEWLTPPVVLPERFRDTIPGLAAPA
ncbi:glycosyltransferase family 2 protein [Plastoroseomonas arctica]|uniref:Glycosyltransferase family 2 protein n=1 Tax=Plastoroseomonas arctica TaxID=1509237 RepID=A0AAF1JUB7_9PROT|nr:glycosyltransferase family 2 protein [Plastoroseomonas arctica]MBR0653614.1 glycosyltransferase family 2 protein [Plastoroseomonas arctica]